MTDGQYLQAQKFLLTEVSQPAASGGSATLRPQRACLLPVPVSFLRFHPLQWHSLHKLIYVKP